MTDTAYVEFLQTSLPHLGLRWQGFRRVRGQVIKRLKRRLRALQLHDLSAYRAYLETHPEEWRVLDSMCRISISRFYRDHGMFQTLQADVLPRLARYVQTRHEGVLRCWSAACASGEEAYTLGIMWHLRVSPRFPDVQIDVVATDIDPHLLARARRGRYAWGSLKDLPAYWIEAGFDRCNQNYVVRETFRHAIRFVEQDIRQAFPQGSFHLILCRNLVFTYFADALQRTLLAGMTSRLVSGGILLVGKHESLPQPHPSMVRYAGQQGFFQKTDALVTPSGRCGWYEFCATRESSKGNGRAGF